MRSYKVLAAVAASTWLFAGCSNQEIPAQQAVASVEQSLSVIRTDAAKFEPEQLAEAEANLANLKTSLDKKEYDAVLAAAPKANAQVVALTDAVVAKQTQVNAAAAEWEALSEEVPKMVQTIEDQVANLPRSKRDAAKLELETMKAMWTEAAAAFDAGDPMQAADKGRMVQAKGKELIQQFGMTPA